VPHLEAAGPGLVERGLLAGTPYVLDYDDAIFRTYDQQRRSFELVALDFEDVPDVMRRWMPGRFLSGPPFPSKRLRRLSWPSSSGAVSLLELARDPSIRDLCVKSARRHFSLEAAVPAYEGIYTRLCSDVASRGFGT
jgi:hypothetical protein